MSRGDFWSRRKAGVEAEALAEQRVRAAEIEAAETARREAETEEKTDEEILAELDLPDPDSLQLGDDVRAFMAKTVPDRIRRRALRKLWRTNPVLACLDGLNDYDDDYTDAVTVVPNLKTAYQVGKGMLAHVEEIARQQEAKALAEAEPSAPPAPDLTLAEETLDEGSAPGDRAAEQDMAAQEGPVVADEMPAQAEDTDPATEEDAPAPAPRRRMRFAHVDN